MDPENKDRQQTPSFLSVLGSVLAGMFGVQSSRRHQADFTHGRPIHYILVGLLATVAFVLIVWGVVTLVLGSVG